VCHHRNQRRATFFLRGFCVCQQADDLHSLLLQQVPKILYQSGLQGRAIPFLRHAGNRAGQVAERHDVRCQPADGHHRTLRRIRSKGAEQLHQQGKGGQEAIGAAAFERQLRRNLGPAVAILAQQGVPRQQQVGDGDFVKVTRAAHVCGGPHRHATGSGQLHVD